MTSECTSRGLLHQWVRTAGPAHLVRLHGYLRTAAVFTARDSPPTLAAAGIGRALDRITSNREALWREAPLM